VSTGVFRRYPRRYPRAWIAGAPAGGVVSASIDYGLTAAVPAATTAIAGKSIAYGVVVNAPASASAVRAAALPLGVIEALGLGRVLSAGASLSLTTVEGLVLAASRTAAAALALGVTEALTPTAGLLAVASLTLGTQTALILNGLPPGASLDLGITTGLAQSAGLLAVASMPFGVTGAMAPAPQTTREGTLALSVEIGLVQVGAAVLQAALGLGLTSLQSQQAGTVASALITYPVLEQLGLVAGGSLMAAQTLAAVMGFTPAAAPSGVSVLELGTQLALTLPAPNAIMAAILSMGVQHGMALAGGAMLQALQALGITTAFLPEPAGGTQQAPLTLSLTTDLALAASRVSAALLSLTSIPALSPDAQHQLGRALALTIQQELALHTQTAQSALIQYGLTASQVQLGGMVHQAVMSLAASLVLAQNGALFSAIGHRIRFTGEQMRAATMTGESMGGASPKGERLV
jgi:hypothetical protein